MALMCETRHPGLLRIRVDRRASGRVCPFADDHLRAEVSERLLHFWQFFRARAGPLAGAALSVRDLLSWAGFINSAAPSIGALPAYAHGAHLTLLDGIGLGAGIPAEVCPCSLPYAYTGMTAGIASWSDLWLGIS